MQIDHVYRCLRCGKEMTIIDGSAILLESQLTESIVDDLTGDESFCHYCDEEKTIIGKLQLIGMNKSRAN